jgi:uncharacterized membrane protein
MSHIIFYGFGFYTGVSLALAVFYFPIIIPIIARLEKRYHWFAFALSVWLFIRLVAGHLSLFREARGIYAPSHQVSPFFVSISVTSGVLLGLIIIGYYFRSCSGDKR